MSVPLSSPFGRRSINPLADPRAQPSDPGITDEGEAVASIRAFLFDAVASFPCQPTPTFSLHPGRPRELADLHLWLAVLLATTTSTLSQIEVQRQLADPVRWSEYPRQLSDAGILKRLSLAGSTVLEDLFTHVLVTLTNRLAPLFAARPCDLAPFASDIVAIDQTTFDSVARRLPNQRGLSRGDHRLLPGKMNTVFDIRCQLWRSIVRVDNVHQNEKATVRELLDGLAPKSLIVSDLGYFSFPWFDELTERDHFWVSRLRLKTSFEVVHVNYEDGETLDALIHLGAHRADRAQHVVRLVQFRQGSVLRQYLTNVLSPMQFSMLAITRVYARRWDIEMAFDLVKTKLKLKVLWSSKPNVVWYQVWAVLIVSQILSALRWEIALAANVDLEEVSMPLLVRYAPQFAAERRNIVSWFVEKGKQLGLIRKSRRIKAVAPDIPLEAYRPVPQDLPLIRKPRQSNGKRNTKRQVRAPALC